MTDQEELDQYYQDAWERINYELMLEELYEQECKANAVKNTN